jgi:hypothetical protein
MLQLERKLFTVIMLISLLLGDCRAKERGLPEKLLRCHVRRMAQSCIVTIVSFSTVEGEFAGDVSEFQRCIVIKYQSSVKRNLFTVK